MNTMSYDKLITAADEGDINLLYAVIQEDPHVLEDIDLIPFIETPLHIAASFGYLQFATEIIRLKPSFGWKLNQQGFSPIHLALHQGQNKMVLRFVEINKDLVRVKGREGLTPLHFASQTGEIELLANFLLACPDSIEDLTVRSETALHVALRYQQYEALQVLVGWIRRTRQSGARQLETTILNWKNEEGNTILHFSALMNDSKALQLLIKTKMDMNAKNLSNLTALDVAANAENKRMLLKASVKPGSSITKSSSLADKLRSNINFLDKIIIFILRIRRDISDDQRNALLIVATLIATATYQSALNPPGGVYQASAGDNNANTTSLNNSTATTNGQGNAGTAVMSAGDFHTLSILNSLSILVSTITIFILTPSGTVGRRLFGPMFFFAFCYLYSMKVISPDYATEKANFIVACIFIGLYVGTSWTFAIVCKKLQRHDRKGEIQTWNTHTRGNRW